MVALREAESRRLSRWLEARRAALAALDAGGREAPAPGAVRRLEEVERQRFAPITTGVYLSPPVRTVRVRKGEEVYSVFIVSDASAADLEALGARVRSQAGDVFTAFVPRSAMAELEASPAVRAIELGRPLFPDLHQGLPYTQISALHAAGTKGAGVIVGVIDYQVLDVYHPGFRTATGATRVRSLWDQTLTPQAGEAPPQTAPNLPGVEYDQAAITAELNHPAGTPAYQTVRHGGAAKTHGTFVTGIAAGNGRDDGGVATAFVGAAPEADIIFVLIPIDDPGRFADKTFVADAFAYVFARATQLGKPCVVNLSMSDDLGPHDGSTGGEQFLDDLLLTPGRVITLSAGNSNRAGSHAAGTVTAGQTVNLRLGYLAGALASDGIEIWYDGHDRFTATVTVPTNPPTTVGPVAPGGPAATATLPGGVEVRLDSYLDDARNHDNLVSVTIVVPAGQQVPPGDWTIALQGTVVVNGAFQAWVDRNNRDQSDWKAPHVQEDTLTLGMPATARRAITAGNHDKAGPPPAIHQTSGRGPTRDGRTKPDIAAPGGLKSTRARDANSANPGAAYDVWGAGTSWSAALVAGTAALVLQCRGAATTWANVKQILQDAAGAAGPATGFGAGYLQVANACAAPAPVVDVWLRDDAGDTGAEPFTGPVAWLSPDIGILDTAGNPVPNPTYHPTNRFNNIVRVTVRNRGTQAARNTEAYLYWADPATYIPYPAAWNASGFYTGAPGFLAQSNVILIPQLAAGAAASVDFAWAPPAPGSNLRGDNHFCLLVRLENESDLSRIGAGGWSVITARNNVALHNVLVQQSPAEMAFYVVGSADQDSLVVYPEILAGQVELTLPVSALPWRDARLIAKHGGRRIAYGAGARVDPLRSAAAALDGAAARARSDVVGADGLALAGGLARLRIAKPRVLFVPHVRIAEGARMPARLVVRRTRIDRQQRFVHVAQLSGGQLVGGVSLELTTEVD